MVKQPELHNLVEDKVLSVLKADPKTIDKEAFGTMVQQAKIGLTYERDLALNARINSAQSIRVITLITDDPDIRRTYIKATMPKFALPELERDEGNDQPMETPNRSE